jgi:hypothetical protein
MVRTLPFAYGVLASRGSLRSSPAVSALPLTGARRAGDASKSKALPALAEKSVRLWMGGRGNHEPAPCRAFGRSRFGPRCRR